MSITFRRLERIDLGLLQHWQAQPHVARWWGPPLDIPALERHYGAAIDGRDTTELFVAQLDGLAIGLIQRYRNRDEPGWDRQVQVPDAAGIDYYIGEPDLIGQGLGPRLIATFVKKLFLDYPDTECVVVGVLQDNRPSWRALEKAGFRRLRSRELDSDEPWDRGPGFLYVQHRF